MSTVYLPWILLATIAFVALLAAVLLRPPMWLMRRLTFAPNDVLFQVATSQRVVALTIDDGPDATTTPALLDLLLAHDARATFFPWGDVAANHAEILDRIVTEGHELGNHLMTDHHCWDFPFERFGSDLRDADRVLRSFGPVRWFRPPGALATSAQYREIGGWGYRAALGSVYPYDAHLKWANFSILFVLWNLKPGAIIVLHDGRGRGERTLAALGRLLPAISKRGYRIVSLSELMSSVEENADA